jgi:methylphosphotriester-DNA--protein-cysteine methyltransferase
MSTIQRCGICGAQKAQLVWRLKSNWRFFCPGPMIGSKDHAQARDREAANQAWVKTTGLYHDRLETVEITDAGLCTWCAEHSKQDPHRACPRCKPVAPPWLKTPCQLCGGSGVLKGAQSLESVVNRITDALQTGHSQTK